MSQLLKSLKKYYLQVKGTKRKDINKSFCLSVVNIFKKIMIIRAFHWSLYIFIIAFQ